MRAVIQAVSSASVRVNGGEPRSIGPGLVILLGVRDTNTLDIVPKLADKCAGLRIFKDENDKLNLSASGARAACGGCLRAVPCRDEPAGPQGRAARRVRRGYAGVSGERGALHHCHRHGRVGAPLVTARPSGKPDHLNS